GRRRNGGPRSRWHGSRHSAAGPQPTESSGGPTAGRKAGGRAAGAGRRAPKAPRGRATGTTSRRTAGAGKTGANGNIMPGSAGCAAVAGGLSTTTPMSGAKMTATNQDTMSAMATTANSENVYSPAELAANPTGTKPAMVTSVPASMAKA